MGFRRQRSGPLTGSSLLRRGRRGGYQELKLAEKAGRITGLREIEPGLPKRNEQLAEHKT